MAKFSFDWTETVYFNTVIEADTIEEARIKFYSNDIDGEIMGSDFEGITHIEECVNE